MSKIGVSIRIDVTKLDRARLYKGEKGTYLDVTGFLDLDQVDEFGKSGFVTQSITKEERQAGVKLPILGNYTIFYREDMGNAPQGNHQASRPPAPPQAPQAPQQMQQPQPAPQAYAPQQGQYQPQPGQAPSGDYDSDDSIPF